MSDWTLHERAWQDIQRDKAEEYISAQRKSFLAGFEAAVDESKEFRQLREWLEDERDRAAAQYDDTGDDMMFARRLAFVDVLVKLSEIGCRAEDSNE